MKKNKKNKRKSWFLLIWFFLVGSLLATSTYAWFSSNRIVQIDFFEVHIETDGGVEISSNAIDWATVLSLNDLVSSHDTYPTSTNQIPSTMKPVSTAGTVDTGTGYLNMYGGSVENDATGNLILTTKREIETEGFGDDSAGSFIAFDIFFRTQSPRELYLSSESYVTYTGDQAYGIENSSRVAFVVEGNRPIDSPINTIQLLKEASDGDVYIWEPNYDSHTQSGVDNALNVYGLTVPLNGGNRINYDGVDGVVERAFNIKVQDANASKYSNLFKRVNVSIATPQNFTTNQHLFSLKAGITKLRIYMWLEGQDVDSENNASYGDIAYFLQFTLNT